MSKLLDSFCLKGAITEQHAKEIEEILKKEKEERQEDIQSVLSMLEGTEDREKIINFINKYLKDN